MSEYGVIIFFIVALIGVAVFLLIRVHNLEYWRDRMLEELNAKSSSMLQDMHRDRLHEIDAKVTLLLQDAGKEFIYNRGKSFH